MVCPLCRGKSEVGVFCSECYLKKNLRIDAPTVIEVPHCKTCEAYLLGRKLVQGLSEEVAVEMAVRSSIKTNISKLYKAGILKVELSKVSGEYIIAIKVSLGGSEAEKRIIARVKNVSCPECSRIAGGYYEAVLQLRGGVSKSTIDSITKSVEKHRDKHAFIGDIRKVPGGFDIYLGSKKSAERIVKDFTGKAEIKRSNELAGIDRQTSKKRYRFYFLIRM